MANLTPEQFRVSINLLKIALADARGLAEIAGVKTLEAQMKLRIFNNGVATDGTKIGPYKSKAWKKKRQKASRQVAYKDLEFSGDMRRGLVTGTSKGHAALGFLQDKHRIWSIGHEEQTGKTIWEPNDEELDAMTQAMIKVIEAQITKALDDIGKL